jgi:hypothetical protein
MAGVVHIHPSEDSMSSTTKAVLLASGLALLAACQSRESGERTRGEATVAPESATAAARTTSLAAEGPSVAATATKNGWWIKVRREKQESPTITFSIGSNNHTVEAWRTWNSGEPLEFDVPEKFQTINPLYIKAQSSGGRNSWFCMMFRGDGVKHFDFDDDEDHEERQSNRDGECNFNN